MGCYKNENGIVNKSKLKGKQAIEKLNEEIRKENERLEAEYRIKMNQAFSKFKEEHAVWLEKYELERASFYERKAVALKEAHGLKVVIPKKIQTLIDEIKEKTILKK